MPGSATPRRRRIVLGIGNPERGDDAAGRAVVRLLRHTPPDDVELIEQDGEMSALLTHLEDAAAVFVVDACASGAPAGTVRRFDLGKDPLPRMAWGVSTHGFGLAEAIELGRVLGQLPPRCVIYAIEGASFAAGAPLSPAVAAAVPAVAARLRSDLAAQEEAGEPPHA